MAFGTIKADAILDSAGETLNIVDAVTNEAHSTSKGYMSAADKVKLDAIAAGAEVNAVTSVNGATGAVTVQGFSGDYDDLTNKPSIPTIDADTVIDANYVATDQNFTTADHTKLDGVEAGAEVNTVTSVNGSVGAVTIQGFSTANNAKLDGIEAGATADQTKADIDALNVDADTLDGQHGAYYTGYADTAVANLVDSSPSTLDTLNELAAALGDDPNFATTVTNSIGTKLPLAGGTVTGDINLQGNFVMQDSSASDHSFGRIQIGANGDLEIHHNGSSSFIDSSGTGDLKIRQFNDDKNIILQNDDGNNGTANYIICNGSNGQVNLYQYGNLKLNTKFDGVNISGELQCDTLDVDGAGDITGVLTLHNDLDMQDDDKILLGAGDDLQIYHDGSNSYIKDSGVGQLVIDGNAVILQYSASSKLTTKSDGVDITGELQCDSLDVDGTADFSGKVNFQGDAAIEGGSGYGIFKGYTGNNNHFITSRGIVTGSTSSPTITGGHNTTFIEYCNTDDTSGFYFKRSDTGTYTEIARITRTGITAPAFVGDGSGLTNLPAAGVSLGLAIALG